MIDDVRNGRHLPVPSHGNHRQTLLTCLEPGSGTTCDTFTTGAWETSHVLSEGRGGHVAWQSPNGTLLMGGPGWTTAGLTTVLLTNNANTTTPGFNLLYPTL